MRAGSRMPILECFALPFIQPSTQPSQPPQILGTPNQHLIASGLCVVIEVGFDPALFGAVAPVPVSSGPPGVSPPSNLPTGNLPTPPIQQVCSVLALIDTGASNSCIDEGLAQQLNLPLINKIPVGGVGGSHILNQYLCRLVIPQLNFSRAGAFIGVHLAQGGQMQQALIGRDFLSQMILIYDGIRGRTTLAV